MGRPVYISKRVAAIATHSGQPWMAANRYPVDLHKDINPAGSIKRRVPFYLNAIYCTGETPSVGVVQVDVRDFIRAEHFLNC